VIDDFARRGATVIATTHNADLKLFAQESPLGRCASFAYDPASFAPTYQARTEPARALFRLRDREPPRRAHGVWWKLRAPVCPSRRAGKQEAILADLAREKAELVPMSQATLDDRADSKVRGTAAGTLTARLARIEDERERMREDTRQRILEAPRGRGSVACGRCSPKPRRN
jgi:hypothetical protein